MQRSMAISRSALRAQCARQQRRQQQLRRAILTGATAAGALILTLVEYDHYRARHPRATVPAPVAVRKLPDLPPIPGLVPRTTGEIPRLPPLPESTYAVARTGRFNEPSGSPSMVIVSYDAEVARLVAAAENTDLAPVE